MSRMSAEHNTETLSGLRINARFEQADDAPRRQTLVLTLSVAVRDNAEYGRETQFREIDTCRLDVPEGLIHLG